MFKIAVQPAARWAINLFLFTSLVLFSFLLSGSTDASSGVRNLYALKLSYTTTTSSAISSTPISAVTSTSKTISSSAASSSTASSSPSPALASATSSSAMLLPQTQTQAPQAVVETPLLDTGFFATTTASSAAKNTAPAPTATGMEKRSLTPDDELVLQSLRQYMSTHTTKLPVMAYDIDFGDHTREITVTETPASQPTGGAADLGGLVLDNKRNLKPIDWRVIQSLYISTHTTKPPVKTYDLYYSDHAAAVTVTEKPPSQATGGAVDLDSLVVDTSRMQRHKRDFAGRSFEELAAANPMKQVWARAATNFSAADTKKLLDDKLTLSASYFGICASNHEAGPVCSGDIANLKALLFPPPVDSKAINSVNATNDPEDLFGLAQRVRDSLSVAPAILAFILLGTALCLSLYLSFPLPSPAWLNSTFLGCLALGILLAVHTVLDLYTAANTAASLLAAAQLAAAQGAGGVLVAAKQGRRTASVGWASVAFACVSLIGLIVLGNRGKGQEDAGLKKLGLVEKWLARKQLAKEDIRVVHPGMQAHTVPSAPYLPPGSRGDNVRKGKAPFPNAWNMF